MTLTAGRIFIYQWINTAKHVIKNNGNSTFTDVTYISGTMCYFDAMGVGVEITIMTDYLICMLVTVRPAATFRYNGNGNFTDVGCKQEQPSKNAGEMIFLITIMMGGATLVCAAAGIDRCDVLLKQQQQYVYKYRFWIGIRDSAFSYGLAKTDYNNDGYVDMCVTMTDSNAYFYKNSGGSNKWIKIRCIGVQSNKDAFGTYVTVYANGLINRQVILGGNSYLSSSDPELIFGIGSAAQADSVVINWTNGQVDRSYNISANGRYTAIEEGVPG
jgi:hypothetical protein